MVVPMPIATPSTAAMIGLTLCASDHGAIHVLRDRVLLFRPSQLDHARRAFVGDYQVPGHEAVLQTSGKANRWRVAGSYPT
jgi:hypothetical protein